MKLLHGPGKCDVSVPCLGLGTPSSQHIGLALQLILVEFTCSEIKPGPVLERFRAKLLQKVVTTPERKNPAPSHPPSPGTTGPCFAPLARRGSGATTKNKIVVWSHQSAYESARSGTKSPFAISKGVPNERRALDSGRPASVASQFKCLCEGTRAVVCCSGSHGSLRIPIIPRGAS
jgi:hypothetical protein